MAQTSDSSEKSFIPAFADRRWMENNATIGNRALKQIEAARAEISRAAKLPESAWPEKLDGDSALAELLCRGLARDPEFVRHCAMAVEGKKQKSPFLFFGKAVKRLDMEGRKALGVSGPEHMTLSEEVEKLLRNGRGDIARQIIFILLAEGSQMFDDDSLSMFLFNDDLSQVHPMMREMHLRRSMRRGHSRAAGEAMTRWLEAVNGVVSPLAPRPPSIRAVQRAARGLRKAVTAGAAYESALVQNVSLGSDADDILAACRRLEKIAPKMGAGELQKNAGHAGSELERVSARKFQADDLRKIRVMVDLPREEMERACREMERADTLLREGGFAGRGEADALFADGKKRAGEALEKLSEALKFVSAIKSGGEEVSADDIEREAVRDIAEVFGGGSGGSGPGGDSASRESGESAGDGSGESDGGAAVKADVFDSLLAKHMIAGEFGRASEVARVALAATGRSLGFSEDEIAFINRAQLALENGKVKYTGGDPAVNESDTDPAAAYESAALNVETELGVDEDRPPRPPAVGLALFAASLSCALTTGDSSAERVMHMASADKQFNDAIWPLKRAVETARKTGITGMLFSSDNPAAASDNGQGGMQAGNGGNGGDNGGEVGADGGADGNGAGGNGVPRVSYKAMRESVINAIREMRATRLNFTLGNRVIQQLTRGELGDLEEHMRENRVGAMERFLKSYGGHKNADRLIEKEVQRAPNNSDKLDGRARKQLVEMVEDIGERCKAYLEFVQNPRADHAGGWLRQQRRDLLKCCDAGAAAVDDFAGRNQGELVDMAVRHCRERLLVIRGLAGDEEDDS